MICVTAFSQKDSSGLRQAAKLQKESLSCWWIISDACTEYLLNILIFIQQNSVQDIIALRRKVLVKSLNVFFSSRLSGHNLPEEHCKYTKQSSSLSSPLPFTHYSPTAHTSLRRAENMLFHNVQGAHCLTPYVSLLGVIKVFSFAAHFCWEAVMIGFTKL